MIKKYIYLTTLFFFLIVPSHAQPCYREVKSGRNFTIALKDDNTLWAWGSNGNHQLGNGTIVSNFNTVQVGTDSNWSQIVVGDYWTLAIKNNGTLWSWGKNDIGQLGNGSMVEITVPTQIGTDTNWLQVSTGRNSSMAIKTDGTLWGWGFNEDGTLGDGTTINRLSPVQVGTANNWAKVAQGYYHNLAIKTNGTLWAWGNNSIYQFDDTGINVTLPTQIGTDSWSEIAAGNAHSVAIKSNGTMWSWGYGGFGSLGHGSSADLAVPTQIGSGTTWQKIAVGLGHNIALKTDGTIWTWGLNNGGQLGNGMQNPALSTTPEMVPVQVGTDTNWTKIAVGSHFTFASKLSSNWSWGSGISGVLGDGSTSGNRLNPALINNCTVLSDYTVADDKTFAQVYPNPVKDILTISTKNILFYSVELYDIQGRIVNVEQSTAAVHQMNISDLAKGTYLLKLISEDKVQTIKILKY